MIIIAITTLSLMAGITNENSVDNVVKRHIELRQVRIEEQRKAKRIAKRDARREAKKQLAYELAVNKHQRRAMVQALTDAVNNSRKDAAAARTNAILSRKGTTHTTINPPARWTLRYR